MLSLRVHIRHNTSICRVDKPIFTNCEMLWPCTVCVAADTPGKLTLSTGGLLPPITLRLWVGAAVSPREGFHQAAPIHRHRSSSSYIFRREIGKPSDVMTSLYFIQRIMPLHGCQGYDMSAGTFTDDGTKRCLQTLSKKHLPGVFFGAFARCVYSMIQGTCFDKPTHDTNNGSYDAIQRVECVQYTGDI